MLQHLCPPGDWGSEVTWDLSIEDGTVLVAGGAPDSQTISVGFEVDGCTDAGANNYDTAQLMRMDLVST